MTFFSGCILGLSGDLGSLVMANNRELAAWGNPENPPNPHHSKSKADCLNGKKG
jgi:hypothetical protein